MHVHSAHHLDTFAAPQPFLSIELVSRSSRSSVHVCRFSDMLQSRAYCLKTLRADGRYLEHQRSLLARLVAGSRKAASEERGAGSVASRRAANGETASGDTEERGVTAFGARFAATGVLRDSRLRPSHGKWLYLVSAWAEGAPLSRIITQRARERRPLLLADSLSLLLAVATDLHDLERCGGSGAVLIHQDLKPSNIIVSPSPVERATVIDLDTAFFLGEPTDAVPCGSYGYTAPEGIMRRPGSSATHDRTSWRTSSGRQGSTRGTPPPRKYADQKERSSRRRGGKGYGQRPVSTSCATTPKENTSRFSFSHPGVRMMPSGAV